MTKTSIRAPKTSVFFAFLKTAVALLLMTASPAWADMLGFECRWTLENSPQFETTITVDTATKTATEPTDIRTYDVVNITVDAVWLLEISPINDMVSIWAIERSSNRGAWHHTFLLVNGTNGGTTRVGNCTEVNG